MSTSKETIVGVDSGGSSCVAACAVDGVVTDIVVRPGANPSTVGIEMAAQTIIGAIDEALGGHNVDAIYVGAAGAGHADRIHALSAVLREHFDGVALRVGDDALIALRAAIPTGAGAVLIAGTGSIAFASDGTENYRCGGLGYLVGDEGSAFSLGLSALRLVAKAYDDRGPKDGFVAAIAQAFGATSLLELIGTVYTTPVDVARIARVATTIIELASKGDRSASRIVQTHAMDLAELAKAVLRKAGMLDASPKLALAGGLLKENSLLSYLLETRLAGDVPGVEIVRSSEEPYIGALRLARELL